MLTENVLLKKYSHFKIGGPARYFLQTDNLDELSDNLKNWRLKNPGGKIFVLGGGTNILFDDRGFDGLVILLKINFIKNLDDVTIEVGASTLVSELIDFTINNSLSGLEWAAGLPGTIGGAIFGNAGAFGGEIKDRILAVKSFSIKNLKTIERQGSELSFGYRTSVFKSDFKNEEIIVSAKFKFRPSKTTEIKKAVVEKITYRQQHQPLEHPNIGSIFKNVAVSKISKKIADNFKDKIKTDPFPVIPAAVFLSEVNLKGHQIGGAQISEKHPNFIINLGDTKASDVRQLINIAKTEVKKKFNLNLELEIIEVEY